MQTLNSYVYYNTVVVQLTIDPATPHRNRNMYARTVKIYNGIDNLIRFEVKNSDQKSLNLTGFDITFNLISDEEGAVLFTTTASAVDLLTGIVEVKIPEIELLHLDNERYNYSLLATNVDTGQQHVVYAGDNYEARGELHLLSGHYPTFKHSISVQMPTTSNSNVITSSITSDTPTRQRSANHTAQFYFNDFTGVIDVQATLDPLPTVSNSGANVSPVWATVTSLSYTAQETPTYLNFNGVYTAVRFIITPALTTTGTVPKILYRA